tara:strand:- start:7 stop:234 length:228 start_codon:yes stop_codon:yes gene_type:complete
MIACGDWVLIQTEQTSSFGIISKSDNKGVCVSASEEHSYLIDAIVYFDNTGTQYQKVGDLTVVPFARIYCFEVVA